MKEDAMKIIYTAILISCVSCSSGAGTGALVGGGAGIGAGALISGTPQGALIGGAVGAVSGATIGAAVDSNSNDGYQAPKNNKRQEQLSLEDIKRMAQAGVADDKIISVIHSTGSVYYLSSAEIADLKNNGVSQRVIDYMIQTGNE